jgi:hypothetical protein
LFTKDIHLTAIKYNTVINECFATYQLKFLIDLPLPPIIVTREGRVFFKDAVNCCDGAV